LPVNFVAMILHPNRKSTKRLHETLERLYGYLDQSTKSKHDDVTKSKETKKKLDSHCAFCFSKSIFLA